MEGFMEEVTLESTLGELHHLQEDKEKSRIWTRESACTKAPGLGKPWTFGEASVMSITSQKAVAAAET